MKPVFLTALFAGSLVFAQQLVIPEELNNDQRKAYKRITESVSAPCCKNAIPVAYHESGMAIHVRNLIKESLLEGKTEKQVMAEMAEVKLGQQQLPLIFAIPDSGNLLGKITWLLPAITIVLGIALVLFILKGTKGRQKKVLSDDDLIERYRGYIESRVKPAP